MSEVTAAAYSASYGGTPTALDSSWGRSWQDRLSEAGGFVLNVQNDDSTALAACGFGSVIRFSLDGSPAFAGVVEAITVHAVAPGEEADEYTEISGRGTMALDDSFVVYPETPLAATLANGRRTFNFASLYLDDSAWFDAVEIEQGLGDPGGPREGFPLGLPPEALGAWWIQADANDVNGSYPAGVQHYRSPVYTSPGELVRIVITADNSHELWHNDELLEVDSVDVAGGVGWAGIKTIDRWLVPGDHLFAVRVTNVAGSDPNPSGFIMAVIQITNSGSTYGSTVLVSDSSWKAIGYLVDPPGFTPGRVLEILHSEAAARGVTVPALGFDAAVDSSGDAWPSTPDISFAIGTKGLAALAQLAETYVDVAMDPATLTLLAWPRGGRGTTTGVSFISGANIMALDHVLTG